MNKGYEVALEVGLLIVVLVFVQLVIAIRYLLKMLDGKISKIGAKIDSMQSAIVLRIEQQQQNDKKIDEIRETVIKDGEHIVS